MHASQHEGADQETHWLAQQSEASSHTASMYLSCRCSWHTAVQGPRDRVMEHCPGHGLSSSALHRHPGRYHQRDAYFPCSGALGLQAVPARQEA
eukprot:3037713-Pyramimonas_sp.AAC.1